MKIRVNWFFLFNQNSTFSGERENAKKHAQEEKSKLLEELKDQVAESILRKEKRRDEELEADKKFSEEAMKKEESARNEERAMR